MPNNNILGDPYVPSISNDIKTLHDNVVLSEHTSPTQYMQSHPETYDEYAHFPYNPQYYDYSEMRTAGYAEVLAEMMSDDGLPGDDVPGDDAPENNGPK